MEIKKNGETWKVDMFSPDTKFEVVQIGEAVEVEVADKEHPIAVFADGYMTLARAKQLVAEIQQAIDMCAHHGEPQKAQDKPSLREGALGS